jgi:adenylylsulfate kinase-like enzyme
MVTGRDPRVGDPTAAEKQSVSSSRILAQDRQQRAGHPAVLVWLNGGPDFAFAVESELFNAGYLTHVIAAQTDGTVLLELAQNLTAAGLVVLCAADFLYEVERERAEALIDPSQFIDVDVSRFDSPDEAAKAVLATLSARRIQVSERS